MDAIGTIGGARRHFVQEHDLVLPLLHAHRVGRQRGQPLLERTQLVIVGGEQGAAPVDVVQMFERRPGDRQAIEGRRAATDLVEDDEAPRRRLVQDGRGLDHLDHEGRAAARQIVGGADAAEQAIDDADGRRLGRHEGTGLRHHRDQRVLAEEGRLAGHVGAGQQPQPPLGAKVAVVGHERQRRPAGRGPPRPRDGARLRSAKEGSSVSTGRT